MEQARVAAVVARYKGVLEAKGNTPVRQSEASPDRDERERKLDHVLWMAHHLESDEAKDYSDAKRNRWLGWMQGVLWAEGVYNLEEQKQHNLRSRSVVGRSIDEE